MPVAVRQLRDHPEAGALLRKVEEWLHSGKAPEAEAAVADLLAPNLRRQRPSIPPRPRRFHELMSFAHPTLLLLLLLPLGGLLWGWKRHGLQVAMPFDHAGAPRRRWTTFWLRSAHSLPLLLLTVAIIIFAGPRQWGLPQDKRVMTNIEFLVDVSGSMMSQYGDGNRYDAAMARWSISSTSVRVMPSA